MCVLELIKRGKARFFVKKVNHRSARGRLVMSSQKFSRSPNKIAVSAMGVQFHVWRRGGTDVPKLAKNNNRNNHSRLSLR